MSPAVPATPGAIPPREWVSLLNGRDLAPVPHGDPSPVGVAMFRFPGLPERLVLPPLDAHYISFTLAGALVIERQLGRDVERAGFRPGMSLILPAGRENAWRWNSATDELHLYVSPAWLGEVALAAGVATPNLFERFAFEDPLLCSLAGALLEDRRSGGVGGALFRDTAAETIALQLLRKHCSVSLPPFRASLAPARLRRVRDLVEARLDHDLSLEDLAMAAGLSRAHFARSFRATTGQTPYAYLRERRVARARSLLSASSQPIIEIAGLTGFRSQSHMGRVFKNATGLTPAEYRRHVSR
ncbi:MAG: AraC family transcriptional regulator [Gaiellales bacterium]|jgi:AraC family transcriptional regulator|nr:AraC family transcriptional regulator [Gaiellales bacterium]